MIFEKHKAIVTANEDDEHRGRIKVACAGLLGDENTELPMWVEPVLAWGWFTVPDVGEMVEVEVVTGGETDESFGQSSIDDLNIRWRGKRFYTGDTTDGENEVRQPHEDFAQNYGKRRGFATPNGHIIYFDDTPGAEKIQISWKQGESDYQYLTMDETGGVILANKNGTMIYMDSENKTFTIIDENSNLISMDENEVKIVDHFSNIISMSDGMVQILSQDAVVMSGKSLNVQTGTIDLLDGADAHLLRGEDVKAWLESHTHPTGMGPSGPPVLPLLPTALSTNCKVK